jgi:hypothetical protein
MNRRFSPQPASSLRAAFEQDKQHALTRHRRGVERVAELMGVPPHVLYKWLETGRMPAAVLPSWEHATGGSGVVRYLASHGHRMLLDIPTGRDVVATDVAGLQRITHDAIGALLGFAEGRTSADDTMGALLHAMGALAWHRENVRKAASPELALEGEA